jgi:hypothetical protein
LHGKRQEEHRKEESQESHQEKETASKKSSSTKSRRAQKSGKKKADEKVGQEKSSQEEACCQKKSGADSSGNTRTTGPVGAPADCDSGRLAFSDGQQAITNTTPRPRSCCLPTKSKAVSRGRRLCRLTAGRQRYRISPRWARKDSGSVLGPQARSKNNFRIS